MSKGGNDHVLDFNMGTPATSISRRGAKYIKVAAHDYNTVLGRCWRKNAKTKPAATYFLTPTLSTQL